MWTGRFAVLHCPEIATEDDEEAVRLMTGFSADHCASPNADLSRGTFLSVPKQKSESEAS